MKKFYLVSASIILLGLGVRLYIALRWPDDEPDDGRVYALIARNILDRHVYSIETDDPVSPTYIRVPGYPIFLAGVYKVFGHDNNRAVRIIQVVVNTAACLLVALLAYAWAPAKWDENKRRRAFLIALALAAACPATLIYVTVILTETWAVFFITLSVLAGAYALKAQTRRSELAWWLCCGAAGGAATMMRPDSAIFVGAVGVSMVVLRMAPVIRILRRRQSAQPVSRLWRPAAMTVLVGGLALSAGFAAVLTPWTIRNARVFHQFQPIAPEGAGMPGEFAYAGYISWLKTWVTDQKWVEVAEWGLDYTKIHVQQLPDSAFDSSEEKDRVAALLAVYNKEPVGGEPEIAPKPKSPDGDSLGSDDDDDSSGDDDSDDAAPQSTNPTHHGVELDVQMTPDLDAQFGEIARERRARHPFRSYVSLPMLRALSMWFDTHSQYYPFQGELFPLAKLDRELHQQIWLPLFALITVLYSVIAAAGVVVLMVGKGSRRWVLLLALLTLPRLAFLSTLENPEPRYVVEIFPFVAAVGAIALATVDPSRLRGWFHMKDRPAASPAKPG